MSFGWVLVILCLSAITQSAYIQRRNIPVEIIYNNGYGKQLNDNVAKRHTIEEHGSSGTKNLHEKSQLSPDEEVDAIKHLPQLTEAIKMEENVQSDDIKSEESPQENNLSLINTAEEIIHAGIRTLKANLDKASATLNNAIPNEESWKNFNKTINEFFKEQYRNTDLKQNQPPSNQNGQNPIIQNIVNGFQSLATNFVQGIQQGNQPNGTEDEQQPGGGFIQTFVSQFSGGVQQISNTINNLGGQSSTSSTVLGDTGVPSTERPNFINNVVSSVQQFFNQNQGLLQGNNQSDTGVPPSGGQNFLQGAINNFNQAINNFRPSTSSPPSGSQGDEGTSTTQRGPIELIQNIGNQISNFFGQGQTSSKPPEDESPSGTTQSTNFIQSIGQTIQNANPFGGQTGSNPLIPGGTQGESNPLTQGIQQINNQIQQFAPNGSNPIETIQNANPFGGQSGSNPLTQGVQQINNQIQQFAPNGTNPLESIQNAFSGVGGSSTEKNLKDLSMEGDTKKTEEMSKPLEMAEEKKSEMMEKKIAM